MYIKYISNYIYEANKFLMHLMQAINKINKIKTINII